MWACLHLLFNMSSTFILHFNSLLLLTTFFVGIYRHRTFFFVGALNYTKCLVNVVTGWSHSAQVVFMNCLAGEGLEDDVCKQNIICTTVHMNTREKLHYIYNTAFPEKD